ncbi:hypothetical protein [Photobacterium leiognathi]|uniref:hypothetical protein n=1 Tax=Photobacterium leiognathi TaxID=553611 RepID=UPI0029827B08|nr:hypothetical protein [Photobacterium leiognathi]
MCRRNETKRALSALSNHATAIDAACYEYGGELPLTEEGQAAAKALLASRLAYPTEDDAGVLLHSSVKKVLNRATSRVRFREKHGEFFGYIETLDYAIANYRATKNHAKLHQDAYEEVRDITAEMMDALKEAALMFHAVINEDLALVYDIDSKLQQIKRCKHEVVKLNDVLTKLTVRHLREWVAVDVRLEALLMKRLKASVDAALADIDHSNLKLVEILLKIENDKQIKRKNMLIDACHNLIERDGSLVRPLIDVEEVPPSLRIDSSLIISDLPSIYDQVGDDELVAIVSQVSEQSDKKIDKHDSQNISVKAKDTRGLTKEIEVDEVDDTLNDLFAALSAGLVIDKVTSMVALHEKLDLRLPVEDWLMCVDTYLDAFGIKAIPKYEVNHVGSTVKPWTGNLAVNDIEFCLRVE